MNERLPYEESMERQLSELNELPLPDQELAWEKMQLLLDKDDDGPGLIPPVFRGCLGWGLLLLLIAVVSWFFFRPDGWFTGRSGKETSKQIPLNGQRSSDSAGTNNKKGYPIPDSIIVSKKNTLQKTVVSDSIIVKEQTEPKQLSRTSDRKPQKETFHERNSITGKNDKEKALRLKLNNDGINNSRYRTPSGKALRKNEPASVKDRSGENRSQKESLPVADTKSSTESFQEHADSLIKIKKDSIVIPAPKDGKLKDTPVLETRKITEQKRENNDSIKKFYFSAGLGLQQQVPIAGQKATPYNYYGRKGSLADYIPSIYLRLHRQEKWFLEGGFRYGAPQSVKEVTYSQQSISLADTSQGQTIITTTTHSSRLKKTFYHQLPFSFNYQLMPNWTVGAGVQYSRFHGAVSEEETDIKRNQVDSFYSKKIVQVPASSDSFFTKSQVHILFQTEYQWRRWGGGVRYTKGLQPFIKYIDAGGVFRKETNQSLQFFLRFRIWQSKK